MGKKLVLDISLTDTSAPTLISTDLIESAGSLLLIDPSHPSQQWPTGVPSDGATLPNVLWRKASALIPDATQATLSPVVSFNAGFDATKAKIERTGKGGLHGIVSQVATVNSGEAFSLVIPDAIKQYILDNFSHSFYASVWKKQTRKVGTIGAGNNPDFLSLVRYQPQISNYLFRMGKSGIYPGDGSSANRLGYRGNGPASDELGDGIFNSGATGWTGVVPGMSNFYTYVSPFGRPLNGVSSVGGHPSFVFYRFYLEDLTVSGRTYAEVDAIDLALYQAQVLSAGGRYNGDTFSDPATTLP